MKPCVCGHARALHDHHRAGTDCAKRGCGCPRYRRRRWWRRTPRPPAAVSVQQANSPGPAPPPGLPRHDCGPIAYKLTKWEGGCVIIRDACGRTVQTIGCRTVDDLRAWDGEMCEWEQGHPL